MRKNIILSILLLVVSFILIASSSYAFFKINKNHGTTTATINSKELSLEFNEGPVVTFNQLLPGATVIKTFSITNNGNVSLLYNLNLLEVVNELTRNTDLIYSITSTNNGGNIANQIFPTTTATLVNNIVINPNTTQEYTITFNYQNLADDQSIDMNKYVTGKISIGDSTEYNTNWYLTTDNNHNGEADIGDLICYNAECFYVTDNTTNIKAIAEHNLMVGGTYDTTTYLYTLYQVPSNIQDDLMLGNSTSLSTYNGVTPYSDLTTHGTTYSDYEGSVANKLVNNYFTKLNQLGASITSASLITQPELVLLGCDYLTGTCNNNNPFISATSYYTSTSGDDNSIWVINSDGTFTTTNYDSTSYGVRPIITLLSNQIKTR